MRERVQVAAPSLGRLSRLDGDGIGLRLGVLPYARHEPADFSSDVGTVSAMEDPPLVSGHRAAGPSASRRDGREYARRCKQREEEESEPLGQLPGERYAAAS